MTGGSRIGPLQQALAVAGLTAAICLSLASRQNPSLALRLMIGAWVLAPLTVLAFIGRWSIGWPIAAKRAWELGGWTVAAAYVGLFGIDVVHPLSAKRALPYVLLPVLAWTIAGGVAAYRRFTRD